MNAVVSKVGVVGHGLMGSGITEVSARAGQDVIESVDEVLGFAAAEDLDRGLVLARLVAPACSAAGSNAVSTPTGGSGHEL